MFYGENLLIEDLPVGTRVIYPKRPMTAVANPQATIRYALNHPEDAVRCMPPARDEGDDRGRRRSIRCQIMRTPDVRQLVPDRVRDARRHGVDDVHM
jgi:hypothetical protein